MEATTTNLIASFVNEEKKFIAKIESETDLKKLNVLKTEITKTTLNYQTKNELIKKIDDKILERICNEENLLYILKYSRLAPEKTGGYSYEIDKGYFNRIHKTVIEKVRELSRQKTLNELLEFKKSILKENFEDSLFFTIDEVILEKVIEAQETKTFDDLIEIRSLFTNNNDHGQNAIGRLTILIGNKKLPQEKDWGKLSNLQDKYLEECRGDNTKNNTFIAKILENRIEELHLEFLRNQNFKNQSQFLNSKKIKKNKISESTIEIYLLEILNQELLNLDLIGLIKAFRITFSNKNTRILFDEKIIELYREKVMKASLVFEKTEYSFKEINKIFRYSTNIRNKVIYNMLLKESYKPDNFNLGIYFKNYKRGLDDKKFIEILISLIQKEENLKYLDNLYALEEMHFTKLGSRPTFEVKREINKRRIQLIDKLEKKEFFIYLKKCIENKDFLNNENFFREKAENFLK